MRRPLLALLAPLLALAGLPAAESAPVTPGFASANVEFVANVPLHADSAGARVVGKYLYASDSRAVTIYDIANPELPVPVGTAPIPQLPYFAQEDIETNGKILVLGQQSNPAGLLVFDVRDKALPRLIGSLRGGGSHTVTCVLDCTYLYNSDGRIVDLREPETPKVVGEWRKGNLGDGAHDLTEIKPGLVMASSNPLVYLDARKNPVKPTVLATGRPGDGRFVHGNLWPRKGTDRFLLVGGETGLGNCADEQAGAFMTWDTRGWRGKGFRLVDDYRPKDTINPTEGGAPLGTYCAHWFTTRPGWRDGGLVAAGWYERGTRFLQVSAKGRIGEVGWYLPAGTSASAAYWVTKDLLYVFDYQRGLDILRFHDKPAATAIRPGAPGLLPTEAPFFRRPLRPSFGRVCPIPG